MVQQLFVLHKLELISDSIIDNLKNAVDLITFEQEDIQFKAEKIAALLFECLFGFFFPSSYGHRCYNSASKPASPIFLSL